MWTLRLVGARTEWTTGEGVAEFTDVPGEEAVIFVDHPGYARQYSYENLVAPDEANVGKANAVEFRLQKEARLRIRFLYPKDQKVGQLFATVNPEATGSQMASADTPGLSSKVTFDRLSPGKNQLTVWAADGNFAGDSGLKREILLNPGDNDLEIAIPRPAPPEPTTEPKPSSLLDRIMEAVRSLN